MTTRRGSPLFPAALALAIALGLLALAPAARGGGFSTVTLDPLREQPRAGADLDVGYTVRSHGVTPVAAPGSGIAIVAADGTRTVSPGRAQGPLGHYVSRVRFPGAGPWRWEADWSGDSAQDLGAVEVAPAGAPPPAATSGGGPGALAWSLLGATLAALALLPAQAVVLLRGRPGRRLGSEP